METKDFIEHLAGKGLGDSTIRSYANYFNHFDEGLEDEKLDQGYVNRFIVKHPSNTTRAFLNNLFELMGITHLNVPKLTGRKSHKKRKSFSKEDIKIFRNWIYQNKNIRYLLLFDLSYYCALRKAEVMGIRVDDFDLNKWVTDPNKSCRLLIRGKGNRERIVPVKVNIMKRIIDYIQDQNKVSGERVFKFSKNKWQDTFKEGVRTLGFSYNFTLHDLRRSMATQWLRDGVDLIRVKNRLGHSSVSSTQLYINLDEEKELERWENE